LSWLRIGTLTLIFGCVGAVWLGWQELGQLRAKNAGLVSDLESYKASLAMMQRSAAIHTAYVQEQLKADQAQAALDQELQSMEGRDAPLSDHLRAAADRLWQ
jgi:hypothetical protein